MIRLESNVLKKTNKYVYFNDGTHITRIDFNHLKIMEQVEIDKLALVSHKDQMIYEQSLLSHIKNKSEWEENKKIINNTPYNYEEAFLEKSREMDTLRNSFTDKARNIYKSIANHLPTILNDFQEEDGLKFIIQENINGGYRFCFDPYKLATNYHSNLSDIYSQEDWYTVNGGWIKLINNTVILYARSGDYGVYLDHIAIQAATTIFPNKKILSFAGKNWNDIDSKYIPK